MTLGLTYDFRKNTVTVKKDNNDLFLARMECIRIVKPSPQLAKDTVNCIATPLVMWASGLVNSELGRLNQYGNKVMDTIVGSDRIQR